MRTHGRQPTDLECKNAKTNQERVKTIQAAVDERVKTIRERAAADEQRAAAEKEIAAADKEVIEAQEAKKALEETEEADELGDRIGYQRNLAPIDKKLEAALKTAKNERAKLAELAAQELELPKRRAETLYCDKLEHLFKDILETARKCEKDEMVLSSSTQIRSPSKVSSPSLTKNTHNFFRGPDLEHQKKLATENQPDWFRGSGSESDSVQV